MDQEFTEIILQALKFFTEAARALHAYFKYRSIKK